MSYARWNPAEYYVVNDVVYDGTVAYNCILANGPLTPQQPSVSPLYWSPLPVGAVFLSHGGFYSTASQVLADAAGVGAGTPVYLTYTNTSSAVGCVLVAGTGGGQSAIQVTLAGTYKLTFSIQWDKYGGGGTNNFQAWVAVNGLNIPDSNSEIDTSQQINQVVTVDIILPLNAGDTVEIVGYVPVGSNHCQALANSIDATHPVGIPSIITDIVRIA